MKAGHFGPTVTSTVSQNRLPPVAAGLQTIFIAVLAFPHGLAFSESCFLAEVRYWRGPQRGPHARTPLCKFKLCKLTKSLRVLATKLGGSIFFRDFDPDEARSAACSVSSYLFLS